MPAGGIYRRENMSKKTVGPNFFIVGAAKAGTTSFAEYLSQHSQVYMSPVKEPHYFSSEIDGARLRQNIEPEKYFSIQPLPKRHALYVRRPEHYQQLFAAAAQAKVRGEASPSYLYSEVAPRRIAEEIEDPRFLILLRNPIERAYSHFRMHYGNDTDDFVKAVARDFHSPNKGWGISTLYVELGRYVPQLKRYLERFPRNRIKICFYDDFSVDLRRSLLEVLSFLEVDATLDGISIGVRYNESHGRPKIFRETSPLNRLWPYRLVRDTISHEYRLKIRHLLSRPPRPMLPEEYAAVASYFREDVLELSELLGRDLTHWLRPGRNARPIDAIELPEETEIPGSPASDFGSTP